MQSRAPAKIIRYLPGRKAGKKPGGCVEAGSGADSRKTRRLTRFSRDCRSSWHAVLKKCRLHLRIGAGWPTRCRSQEDGYIGGDQQPAELIVQFSGRDRAERSRGSAGMKNCVEKMRQVRRVRRFTAASSSVLRSRRFLGFALFGAENVKR